MNFAFADPPYLGCCSYYGHNHGVLGRTFDGLCWDHVGTHELLIAWLRDEYPDGWAYCASSPTLPVLTCLRPNNRIGAWVKPFASFKPGINPGYCWEPVVFAGGRKLGRDVDTVRDFISESITLEKGLTGAKPFKVCLWVLDMLGYQPGIDELDDIFPGTGVMGKAVAYRCGMPAEQLRLTP